MVIYGMEDGNYLVACCIDIDIFMLLLVGRSMCVCVCVYVCVRRLGGSCGVEIIESMYDGLSLSLLAVRNDLIFHHSYYYHQRVGLCVRVARLPARVVQENHGSIQSKRRIKKSIRSLVPVRLFLCIFLRRSIPRNRISSMNLVLFIVVSL